MCRPKAEGGKRCAAHMRGSRAAIKSAEVHTKADRRIIMVVMRELREEGKNLPAPAKEEVQNFADEQRFRARFDESLSNRDRTTLINGWEAAREEEPDGGLFHSWKNLRAGVMGRLRRIAAIGSIALVAATTVAGCGGALNEPPAPTETTSSAPVEVETPSPRPTDLGGGIVASDVVLSDSYGEYTKLELAEDSPLLQWNEEAVDGNVLDYFTREEVLEAQSVASRFVVEEGLDSPILYDFTVERAEEWAKTLPLHPYWRDEMIGSFRKSDEKGEMPIFVENAGGRNTYNEAGEAVSGVWDRGTPNNQGGIRADSLDVNLERVSLQGRAPEQPEGPILVFEYSVTGKRPAIWDRDGELINYNESLNHQMRYSVDTDNGAWLINGFSNSIDVSIVDQQQ